MFPVVFLLQFDTKVLRYESVSYQKRDLLLNSFIIKIVLNSLIF